MIAESSRNFFFFLIFSVTEKKQLRNDCHFLPFNYLCQGTRLCDSWCFSVFVNKITQL